MYSHYVSSYPPSDKICIFGTGGASYQLTLLLMACRQDISVSIYADSYKKGGYYRGKPIINIDDLTDDQYDYFIIASHVADQIEYALRQRGLQKDIHRFYMNTMFFTAANPKYACYDIGDYTYGAPLVENTSAMRGLSPSEFKSTLRIGKFCSIADNVTFLLERDHCVNCVTTAYIPFLGEGDNAKNVTKGDITIGNDVWIGRNALILSGVHVGDGAVIGANTVVAKNIEPYTICIGNPQRNIRKRFTDKQIEELLRLKWWDKDMAFIQKHRNLLLNTNVDQFISALKHH